MLEGETMRFEHKRTALWSALLALVFAVALPTVSFGQGRGHGRNHSDVFVNGHDARDGRYDGRGPRADRRGRNGDDDRDNDGDDDDRYRNGGYCHRRYRNNGRVWEKRGGLCRWG